jgi:hypothetical protein
MAHDPPGDLAHLVLDLATPLRALIHGVHMSPEQERRRIDGGAQSLSLSYSGEIPIMLACPIHIHSA